MCLRNFDNDAKLCLFGEFSESAREEFKRIINKIAIVLRDERVSRNVIFEIDFFHFISFVF